LPKHYFHSHVEPHDFLCQPQSLHGLALFAAYPIATVCDQGIICYKLRIQLRITGSMPDLPSSRTPSKLSTDAKVL